jgi:4-hydroxybenzoate polyprenyltransferase
MCGLFGLCNLFELNNAFVSIPIQNSVKLHTRLHYIHPPKQTNDHDQDNNQDQDKNQDKNHDQDKNNNNNNNNNNNSKLAGIVSLLRPKSILPTLLLNFSGGWIMNPSLHNLLQCPSFIIATINTILILASSMIINDIYDVQIDRINNPTRPLVTGQVSIDEAFGLFILLISMAEILTIGFLPNNFKYIIDFAMINITIYTPFLKRIPLIKNISCAALVAFTIYFSGLSSVNGLITTHENYKFLIIAMNLIFGGSLSNEILLDIRDYHGDKDNNIKTIPVLFGKDAAFVIVNIISTLSVLLNSLSLSHVMDYKYGVILSIVCSPLTFNLYKVKVNEYSRESINEVVNNTNLPLFLTLVYFSLLSTITVIRPLWA